MASTVKEISVGKGLTAYSAYRKAGGTWSYEEWSEKMAKSGVYAESAEEAMTAAGESATRAETAADKAEHTADDFEVRYEQAIIGIVDKGTEQTQRLETEGDRIIQRISDTEDGAVGAVTDAQTGAVETVNTAKTNAVSAVGEAQTTGVQAVNSAKDIAIEAVQTEGETQVQAVADKGAEQVEAVEAVLGDLQQDVTDLKTDIDTKADIDGYYEEMSVGDAEQLISTQYVEDSVPYKYRISGGSVDIGNREYVRKIIGGTVGWNQIMPSAVVSNANAWTMQNCNVSASDGIVIFTSITSGESNIVTVREAVMKSSVFTNNHVYVFGASVTSSQTGVKISSALDQSTISYNQLLANIDVPTNTWQRVYGMCKFASIEEHIPRLRIVTVSGYTLSENETLSMKDIVLFDLTQMFGATIADYVYSLETTTPGAGVAWFRVLFPDDYYAYNSGELISVSGLQSHDMVGFNLFDKSTHVPGAGINTSGDFTVRANGWRSDYIRVLPETQYYISGLIDTRNSLIVYYDGDKQFLSRSPAVKNTGLRFTTPQSCQYIAFSQYSTDASDTLIDNSDDVCINLVWSGSRNGEYEEYKKHSYPLDSTLTLRGIPKLDAQNRLYYDGDEYLPNGTVTRKYGIVDLGTLDWSYITSASVPYFRSSDISDIKSIAQNTDSIKMFTGLYEPITQDKWSQKDKTICKLANNLKILVHDESYTDADTFKAAMSGVYFVYELATPTAETAEPYQEVQIVDDWETEEYVSGTIVPVGHETEYPANLRDKLQHLPSLASDDGYYVIQQIGTQMSLVQFRIPQAPSTDGTYTLKATVSGGTPTYVWEAVT